MPDIVVKKTRLLKWVSTGKILGIHIKYVYNHTLLIEFAVGTVTIVSQIFESPICILMHKDYCFDIWGKFSAWRHLNRIINFNVRFSLILARCRIFISNWSLESLSRYDRMNVLSWTSSTRNSLYIWRWKHHFWGAIRIIYRVPSRWCFK